VALGGRRQWQQEWETALSTSGDQALSRLSSLVELPLTAASAEQRVLVHALLGRVLQLAAEHERQHLVKGHSPGVWNTAALEALRTPLAGDNLPGAATTERATDVDVDPATAVKEGKQRRHAARLRHAGAESVAVAVGGGRGGDDPAAAAVDPPPAPASPLTRHAVGLAMAMQQQAVAALDAAISHALHHGLYGPLETAALHMLTGVGLGDGAAAAKYLALYQACCARRHLEGVLHQACAPAFASKERTTVNVAQADPTQAAGLQRQLEACSAPYKRLRIAPGFLDQIGNIPCEFNCLLLQHSPDMRYLYAAVLGGAGGTGGELRTVRAEVDPTVFTQLLDDVSQYRRDVTADLLGEYTQERAAEEATTGVASREADADLSAAPAAKSEGPLPPASASVAAAGTGPCADADAVARGSQPDVQKFAAPKYERGSQLDSVLAALVMRVHRYLHAVLEPLAERLVPSPGGDDGKRAEEQQGVSVVLLADHQLLELPLEGLPLLSQSAVVSVSRDYSAAILCSRLADGHPEADADDAAAQDGPKSGSGSGGGGGKSLAKSAAKSKSGKKEPLESVRAAVGQLAYVVDPFGDCCDGGDALELVSGFAATIREEVSASKSWVGVSGAGLGARAPPGVSSRIPSTSELVAALRRATGLVYYGPGSLLSSLYPVELAALPLPGCRLAVLLDGVVTPAVRKNQDRRAHLRWETTGSQLNSPGATAALLSLSGVTSVAVNSWGSTAADNERRLRSMLKDLTRPDGEGGVGRAVGRLLGPKLDPKKPDEPADKKGKGGKSGKGGKGGKGGAADEQLNAPVAPPPPIYLPPTFRLNTVLYGLPNVSLS
jgi:hypothetical protein